MKMKNVIHIDLPQARQGMKVGCKPRLSNEEWNAEIQMVLQKRELWFRERLIGLAEIFDAAGCCVVVFGDRNIPTWIGGEAEAWLRSNASDLKMCNLSEDSLNESVASSSHSILLYSSQLLVIWQSLVHEPAVSNSQHLSPRERAVLDWLRQGKTAFEIGIILEISPRTVEKHVQSIYRKLGINQRATLILKRPALK